MLTTLISEMIILMTCVHFLLLVMRVLDVQLNLTINFLALKPLLGIPRKDTRISFLKWQPAVLRIVNSCYQYELGNGTCRPLPIPSAVSRAYPSTSTHGIGKICLKQCVATRWNSTYGMLEVVQFQQPAVMAACFIW